MTAFLRDLNSEGQYHKLIRRVERFRDAGELMWIIENDYPDDASEMMQLLFSFVRAGRTHLDVRTLRRMFRLARDRYERLRDAIASEEATWEESATPELATPVLDGKRADGEGEGDDDEAEPTTPSVANYPTDRITDIINTHLDAFTTAQQSNTRVQLIQARSRLEEVTPDRLRQALHDPTGEALEALRFIVEWADQMRGELPS